MLESDVAGRKQGQARVDRSLRLAHPDLVAPSPQEAGLRYSMQACSLAGREGAPICKFSLHACSHLFWGWVALSAHGAIASCLSRAHSNA
eukprot:87093-Rhodomonas_salina.1